MVQIQRVVSVFILSRSNRCGDVLDRENVRVAVFHRVNTMPSFPGHFAACSGSIEPGETPWEAACRELKEETSIESELPDRMHGLYVDVPHKQRIYRVYPFCLELNNIYENDLELRGTEHDSVRFVSLSEFEVLQPAVPALAQAFHHATHGKYLPLVSDKIRSWASDTINGAATLAKNAVLLLLEAEETAQMLPDHTNILVKMASQMKMMRPSMVAITNVLQAVEDRRLTPSQALQSLKDCNDEAIRAAVDRIRKNIENILDERKAHRSSTPTLIRIATFSRSSTLVAILQKLVVLEFNLLPENVSVEVICGKSTPGEEGKIMAEYDLGNLGAICVEDAVLETMLRSSQRGQGIDLLLLGSDCIMEKIVVNKVRTTLVAEAARGSGTCVVLCCADRLKIWEDIFPPPLEHIFECVPRNLLDDVVVSSGEITSWENEGRKNEGNG